MHRRPRLFCAAGRSALPGGGVVLCGVIRLCGVGRSTLRGGFSLAFCGRLRCVRSRPVGGAVQGRGIGFAARLPPVAGADGRCGRQDGFRVRCLLSCGASCLLLPASCLLLPASCLPPSAVETGRTVKTAGSILKKDASRSIVGVSRVAGRMGGGTEDSFACPARRKFRPRRPGSPFAARPLRLTFHGSPFTAGLLTAAPYFLPFTFHFSLSANPCEMKVRIGSRPVRQ